LRGLGKWKKFLRGNGFGFGKFGEFLEEEEDIEYKEKQEGLNIDPVK
jgi:hypothetical protein